MKTFNLNCIFPLCNFNCTGAEIDCVIATKSQLPPQPGWKFAMSVLSSPSVLISCPSDSYPWQLVTLIVRKHAMFNSRKYSISEIDLDKQNKTLVRRKRITAET